MGKCTFLHVCPMKSNQPAHLCSFIRVFVIYTNKFCFLGYLKYTQRRFWSACAYAQADLNLPWAYISEAAFSDIVTQIINIFIGTICDIPELLEFAKLGCYIDYDLFGIETSNYQLLPSTDMPSDAQRLDRIKALVEAGYEDRVTVGQDIHTKHRLVSDFLLFENSLFSSFFHQKIVIFFFSSKT